MAFCKNCGQELTADTSFCPSCGTAVEAPAQAAPVEETPVQAAPVEEAPAQETPVQEAKPVEYVAQTNEYTGDTPLGEEEDIKANKGISILSYFGLLLLIPLFVRKTSEYCKYHVKQGANLLVMTVAYTVVTQILLAVIGLIFRPTVHTYYWVSYTTPHPVHTIFNIIFSLGTIFFLVVAIIGMVNAGTGKKKPMPILGGITFMDSVMDKIYDSLNK